MKGVELGTEAIPGCVLQIYVLLNNEEAQTGALVSIVISALTTGYVSSIIAFEKDIEDDGRKYMSNFYGYIPDDLVKRGTCFALLMLISALHNVSRSIGFALLAASSKSRKVFFFVVGGEMAVYLAYKLARRDFLYWVQVEGLFGAIVSFFERVVVKVIVDFSGCVHFRHP